jgi:hypothetical protein
MPRPVGTGSGVPRGWGNPDDRRSKGWEWPCNFVCEDKYEDKYEEPSLYWCEAGFAQRSNGALDIVRAHYEWHKEQGDV